MLKYEELGPVRKRAWGVKDLNYAWKCFDKGKTEKGIAALEKIAAQEGRLDWGDSGDRFYAGSILLHLAILGSYHRKIADRRFDVEAPEYQCRENAEQAVGWLLRHVEIDAVERAKQYKKKPEDYTNEVYFIRALLAEDREERFVRMKEAVKFHSNEARWWLLWNGLFTKAFPEEEQQKEEYFLLYCVMNVWEKLWTGSVGATPALQQWMLREGGFVRTCVQNEETVELIAQSGDLLKKMTAREMKKDVLTVLELLKERGSSVGIETLQRIEEKDKKDKEELERLIKESEFWRETAATFNRMMEEDAAFKAGIDISSSSGGVKGGRRTEFGVASMPVIIYDSSNQQWKRRGIFGDHAVYYSDNGGEVTIYDAQVSTASATTSAGIFHWY